MLPAGANAGAQRRMMQRDFALDCLKQLVSLFGASNDSSHRAIRATFSANTRRREHPARKENMARQPNLGMMSVPSNAATASR